ncbi:MAG: ABC transporter permease, partial [Bdellovibrio sp.]
VGLIHGFFHLNSFLVSLAFMQVFRGVAKGLAEEKTVVAPESPLSLLMLVDPEPDWLMLAPGIWITLICAFLVHVLLTRTRIGKYVFAIGSNEKTAVLCGVNVPRYRLLFFLISGFFVGLAGVLQFGNLTVGDPSAGHGYELDLIAACVLGGASLKGGTGSVTGTMVGALAMAVLRNGCNMMGIPTWVQEILIGAVILAVVGMDQLKLKSRAA